jgi:hypothetical protein
MGGLFCIAARNAYPCAGRNDGYFPTHILIPYKEKKQGI